MSDEIHAANVSTASVIEAPPKPAQADSKVLERVMGVASQELAKIEPQRDPVL